MDTGGSKKEDGSGARKKGTVWRTTGQEEKSETQRGDDTSTAKGERETKREREERTPRHAAPRDT